MELPPLELITANRIPVRLVGSPAPHPTAGYRQWAGRIEAGCPIVAFVVNVTGSRTCWARTSHRAAESLEARILFAPYDAEGRRIQICFSISDATAYGQTVTASSLDHPAPHVGEFFTGQLVTVSRSDGDPPCELKALFLTRDDVKSVRNGVWHVRGNIASTLPEPWHTVLTYGRAGELPLP